MSYNNSTIIYDVLEAIHLAYEEAPEIEAKCYLYLANLHKDHLGGLRLGLKCIEKLDEMNRCSICGSSLIESENFILHTELDEKPIEYKYELKCPICDLEEE